MKTQTESELHSANNEGTTSPGDSSSSTKAYSLSARNNHFLMFARNTNLSSGSGSSAALSVFTVFPAVENTCWSAQTCPAHRD